MSKELEARISLLRYYSSKSTANGTRILTIVIGFFASTQVLDKISTLKLGSVVINEGILLSTLISVFSALLFHQFLRLLVWARLTEIAIHITFPQERKRNLLDTLNGAIIDHLTGEEAPEGYRRERKDKFIALFFKREIQLAIVFFILAEFMQMLPQVTILDC